MSSRRRVSTASMARRSLSSSVSLTPQSLGQFVPSAHDGVASENDPSVHYVAGLEALAGVAVHHDASVAVPRPAVVRVGRYDLAVEVDVDLVRVVGRGFELDGAANRDTGTDGVQRL